MTRYRCRNDECHRLGQFLAPDEVERIPNLGNGLYHMVAVDGLGDLPCGPVEEIEGPCRIRLSRKKGWRKPAGAVVVARPSRWGNPFTVGMVVESMNWLEGEMEPLTLRNVGMCVSYFKQSIGVGSTFWHDVRRELRGKDLACWCHLTQPCHADVLLEIANG